MNENEGKMMNGVLILVGLISLFVGILFLYFGIGGKVSADTEFGQYSVPVGAVAVVLGIILMAFGALM
jgi:hypothetical protein